MSAFFGKMRLARLTNYISISSSMVSRACNYRVIVCLLTVSIHPSSPGSGEIKFDSPESPSARPMSAILCSVTLHQIPPKYHTHFMLFQKISTFFFFFFLRNVFSTQKVRNFSPSFCHIRKKTYIAAQNYDIIFARVENIHYIYPRETSPGLKPTEPQFSKRQHEAKNDVQLGGFLFLLLSPKE